MKTRPLGSKLFQKVCHEMHGQDKGCFRIFQIAPNNLHTRTHTHKHRCFCHIILLSILSTAVPIHITGDYNHFTICKIVLNFIKSIGHYFCPTVLRGLRVHISCWYFTWSLGERFEIGVFLTILINNTYVTRKTKQNKGAIWNTVEMWKDRSETSDRMWRENWVANGGLKEL
jgi:hypothetical protein